MRYSAGRGGRDRPDFGPFRWRFASSPVRGGLGRGGKRFVENRHQRSPRSGVSGPSPPPGLWASPNRLLFPCLSCACPDPSPRDAAPAGGKSPQESPPHRAARGRPAAGPGPPRTAPPQPGRRGSPSPKFQLISSRPSGRGVDCAWLAGCVGCRSVVRYGQHVVLAMRRIMSVFGGEVYRICPHSLLPACPPAP